MSQSIVIIVDSVKGNIKPVVYEAIEAGRRLHDQATIHCILCGEVVAQTTVQSLQDAGVSKIEQIEMNAAFIYSSRNFITGLTKRLQEKKCNVVIFAGESFSRVIMPQVASRFLIEPVLGVTDVRVEGTVYTYERFVKNAHYIEELESTEAMQFFSVRANHFIPREQENISESGVSMTIHPYETDEFEKEVVEAKRQKRTIYPKALSDAEIIVSGGRGIHDEATFKQLIELSDIVGGTVGGARGAYEAGYCRESQLVGQSNTKVSPNLYIAFGISGSNQHLGGIMETETIIVINPDLNANIYTHADYGIVGKADEVLPILIEEIQTKGYFQ